MTTMCHPTQELRKLQEENEALIAEWESKHGQIQTMPIEINREKEFRFVVAAPYSRLEN